MNNKLLYVVVVGIWGSTFLAIKFQLGTVAPELSIVYRFALAAVVLVGFSLARGLRMRFSWRDHAFIAMQGFFLFSLNYILVYLADDLLASGLVATIFSLVIILNSGLGALLLGTPIRRRVILGGIVGIGGLVLVFWDEIITFDLSDEATTGLIFGFIAAVSASIGNIVSARNQRQKLPVVQTNAYGMAYGTMMTLFFALVRGAELNFEWTFGYVSSLLYLAMFGSVIAFGAYLSLLGSIGADRAAYVTVLFPIVALGLSTVIEDLAWTPLALIGVVFVLLGNVIALTKLKAIRWPVRAKVEQLS